MRVEPSSSFEEYNWVLILAVKKIDGECDGADDNDELNGGHIVLEIQKVF